MVSNWTMIQALFDCPYLSRSENNFIESFSEEDQNVIRGWEQELLVRLYTRFVVEA